jgi:hypothetical protein
MAKKSTNKHRAAWRIKSPGRDPVLAKKSTRKHHVAWRSKPGRDPVIAVRVPEPLHRRITAEAKRTGQSMSELMADLLGRGFEWQDAFGDRYQMLKEANATAKQIAADQLEAEMRRHGWNRLWGTPYWLPPGSMPESGFIVAEPEGKQQNHFEAIITRAVRTALAEVKEETL